jgi:hypothetical protein
MKMRRLRTTQRLFVVMAVMLLITATFAAGVCHDHHGASETTCQICHVGHQPVDQHLVSTRVVSPMVVATAQVLADPIPVSGPVLRVFGSRAPPLS